MSLSLFSTQSITRLHHGFPVPKASRRRVNAEALPEERVEAFTEARPKGPGEFQATSNDSRPFVCCLPANANLRCSCYRLD
jgi:hypothetical protein